MCDSCKGYGDKELKLLLSPVAANLLSEALVHPPKGKEIDYTAIVQMYSVYLDELCNTFKTLHHIED